MAPLIATATVAYKQPHVPHEDPRVMLDSCCLRPDRKPGGRVAKRLSHDIGRKQVRKPDSHGRCNDGALIDGHQIQRCRYSITAPFPRHQELDIGISRPRLLSIRRNGHLQARRRMEGPRVESLVFYLGRLSGNKGPPLRSIPRESEPAATLRIHSLPAVATISRSAPTGDLDDHSLYAGASTRLSVWDRATCMIFKAYWSIQSPIDLCSKLRRVVQ